MELVTNSCLFIFFSSFIVIARSIAIQSSRNHCIGDNNTFHSQTFFISKIVLCTQTHISMQINLWFYARHVVIMVHLTRSTHTHKIFKFLHQFDKKPQFVFCSHVHVTCLRVHTVAISFRWVYAYIHHQTKWTERKIRCNAKQRDNVVLAFRTTPISHHSVCVCVPAWFLSIELKWLIALVHLWSAFVFIQLVYRACTLDG